MKTWNYIDRSDWPEGEWTDEPDKIHWIDEQTDMDCLIVRNSSGNLCGYVGVNPDHNLHGKDYSDVEDKDVHRGLTFSSACSPSPDNPEHGICHIPEGEREENVWWLGFDCAHSGDLIPTYEYTEHGIYRNIYYVRRECENLAAQLKEL